MKNKFNRKISIIGGAGNIGLNIAELLCTTQKICNEIVLCDVSGDSARGRALDLMQGSLMVSGLTKIIGTENFEEISGSDVIIIPAGVPRKPGMTRDDLVSVNLGIIKNISENIKKYAPGAFVIVITNPLDIMVYAAYKFSGLAPNMIVGMAGALDGARFSFQVSKYLGLGFDKINSMVIGAHNDEMVVLPRHSSVSGIPISEFVENGMIPKEALEEMIQKTKTGGAEIVKFLGNGSASFNPAACAVSMASSYLNDEKIIFSCSSFLSGQYGFKDIFVGVPVVLGASGVEKIIELKLNEKEKADLEKSVQTIKDGIKNL
jgi:malate dehydrogenase